MPNWKTEVDIRRGIFQDDSLSPLLFVIAVIPISILLNREKMGYRLGGEGGQGGEGREGGEKINHSLFPDNLMVYGVNWGKLQVCKIEQKLLSFMWMVFGLYKCVMLEIQSGHAQIDSHNFICLGGKESWIMKIHSYYGVQSEGRG